MHGHATVAAQYKLWKKRGGCGFVQALLVVHHLQGGCRVSVSLLMWHLWWWRRLLHLVLLVWPLGRLGHFQRTGCGRTGVRVRLGEVVRRRWVGRCRRRRVLVLVKLRCRGYRCCMAKLGRRWKLNQTSWCGCC